MTDRNPRPAVACPTLIGVGVGPGDPELLTLKAVRAIREADVVFAPVRHAGDRSMALQIVADHLDPARQEIVTVPFPRTDRGESWRTASASMLSRLGGRRGVFLTEGDPLLFGSFGDVLAALGPASASVGVAAIPGISSVTAAAAASLLPLTDHDQRLAIVPATAGVSEIEAAIRQYDCVVLLKVGRLLGSLLDLLAAHGRLDSTVYIRRCGWPDQEIVHDVRRLRASPPRDYFALLIVHRPRHAEEYDGNVS
ncbi:MAG: precorrin-2 C(20)-methyltransferase [Chloroflexi bacterium]|nr:precorrin-2 C(20)-methyltransferase [Chloroflexota bacterium]